MEVRQPDTLPKYSRSTLEKMTLVGLKRLAVGVVPGAGRMKRPELIALLQREEARGSSRQGASQPQTRFGVKSTDTRLSDGDEVGESAQNHQDLCKANQGEELEVSLKTPPAKSKEPLASFSLPVALLDWTKGLYVEFRALVQSRWCADGSWDGAISTDLSGLGYRVIRFLDDYIGEQDDGGLAVTTKMRYRTHVCNLLTSLVEAERGAMYFQQLHSCLEILLRQIKIQIADVAAKKKGLQERRLAVRKKRKLTISFEPLHSEAQRILSSLDQLTTRDWKKVSIALAIATGRRMAEIHLVTTSLVYVDRWHVEFTGQLKTKGDAQEYFEKNPSYTIPVLVNAELVEVAHRWLKEHGKVVPTASAAARRYSGDLSNAVKHLSKRYGIDHEFFTYKGLRTIYAQVCNQVFNNNDPDNTLYFAEILGHGRGELLRGEDLIDMLTPQSYNSDFRVVNTECVLR